MLNLTSDYRRTEGGDVRALLRHVLSQVQAIRIDDIERRTNLDTDSVHKGIEDLVAAQEVEVIRPRFNPQRAEFFRLLRETDDDYRWQQELAFRIPSDRLHDLSGTQGLARHQGEHWLD